LSSGLFSQCCELVLESHGNCIRHSWKVLENLSFKSCLQLLRILSRDSKRSSHFRTSNYMFELKFRFVKFGIRIRLAPKQEWVLKRGWHIIICEQDAMSLFLLAAAPRRITCRLARPPSTLLVFDYPSPPPHLSLPLWLRHTVCLLSCCCSQHSHHALCNEANSS